MVLTMASCLADQDPSLLFNEFDRIPHLQGHDLLLLAQANIFQGNLSSRLRTRTRAFLPADSVSECTNAVAAFKHMESGSHFGKVVIRV